MADTANTYDAAATTESAGHPSLHVVGDQADSPEVALEHATEDEARIWRSAMIGSAVGFAVVTTGITIAGTIGGIGAASALGLGAFVGTFGGAGFGFMMGATLSLARLYDAGHAARSKRL